MGPTSHMRGLKRQPMGRRATAEHPPRNRPRTARPREAQHAADTGTSQGGPVVLAAVFFIPIVVLILWAILAH